MPVAVAFAEHIYSSTTTFKCFKTNMMRRFFLQNVQCIVQSRVGMKHEKAPVLVDIFFLD